MCTTHTWPSAPGYLLYRLHQSPGIIVPSASPQTGESGADSTQRRWWAAGILIGEQSMLSPILMHIHKTLGFSAPLLAVNLRREWQQTEGCSQQEYFESLVDYPKKMLKSKAGLQ